MNVLLLLIPVALLLGGLGLAAFLWALKSGQFEDLDGAAHRILIDDDEQESSDLEQIRDDVTQFLSCRSGAEGDSLSQFGG